MTNIADEIDNMYRSLRMTKMEITDPKSYIVTVDISGDVKKELNVSLDNIKLTNNVSDYCIKLGGDSEIHLSRGKSIFKMDKKNYKITYMMYLNEKNYVELTVNAELVKSPTPLPKSKPKPAKECPEGKVRNPKTGRCIKPKSVPAQKSKPAKECREGKVRNPKTGRCVKAK